MITIKVNYAAVTRMARDLAQASAQPYKRVLQLETASIIKICAIRAKPASVAKIRRAVALDADRMLVTADESVLAVNYRQNAGRVWFAPGDKHAVARDAGKSLRATRGEGPEEPGKLRPVLQHGGFFLVYGAGRSRGWHLPDLYWQAYLIAVDDKAGYVKARIAELTRRRGLQMASWIQISDQLGVPLSSVSPGGALDEAVARNARGPRGKVFQNGTALVRSAGASLTITIVNASPLAIKNQGQRSLDSAINQRLDGFEWAMRKEVFKDLKLRAQRWRGIFVTE